MSPVIAVILMVAITVVLAAVLYVMVINMIEPVKPTPKVSLIASDTMGGKNWTVQMTGLGGDNNLKDFQVVLLDRNKAEKAIITDLTADSANNTLGDSKWMLVFNRGSENLKLSASQSFFINGIHSGDPNYVEDWTVKLIYKETNDVSGSTVLT